MELHLTNLVPDQIIKALCNTLIHSLWQGLILAAVTGLTIVLTKKASAALRYNLMISFLVLFSAAITFTFFSQLHFSTQETNHIATTGKVFTYQLAPGDVATGKSQQNIINNCISYFNTHSDTIVLIWFLIICARCVQLGAGLHNIYYIKRTKVISAGTYWDNKIAELSKQLGVVRTIKLMQSGIAKLPMVLGHFKPVILIPIGLLTALSTEEVESILVHELAHIRRRDYLVNLLQNLMEILFFFNPAVLWVSALIKAERENCCDDIVVAQTGSKVSYIKALVSCQEYQSAIPAYAMGLGGNSDHFLQRVKRMLSNNNQSLNKVEKMVLTICLISAVLLTAAFSKSGKEHTTVKPSAKRFSSTQRVTKTDSSTRITSIKNDSLTTGKNKIRIYKPNEVADGTVMRMHQSIGGTLYAIFVVKTGGTVYQSVGLDDGNKTNYYINGKSVSKVQFAQHQPLFDRLISESDERASKFPAQLRGLQNNGGVGEIVDKADSLAQANANNDSNQQLIVLKESLGKLNAKQALDSLKLKSLADRNNGLLKTNQLKLKADLSKLDTQQAIAAYKLRMLKMDSTGRVWSKKPISPKKPYGYKYDKKYKGDYDARYKPYQPYEPQELKEPVEPKTATIPTVAKAYGSYQSAPGTPPSPVSTVGDGITNQLINDRLIKDKDNYTYKITNSELYIDGVKQPDDVHKRIVEKYLKPGDNINYTRTNTTNNK